MSNGEERRPRLRVPVLGMVGGFFGALGVLLLFQQYEIVYPTRTMTIAFLVGGVLLNLVVANVVAASTRSAPIAPAAAEPAAVEPMAVDASEGAPAPATIDPAPWTPTHVVPGSGLPAWAAPDPQATPVASLDPGLEVVLDDRQGDWAHVVCSNSWTAWVDGRLLEPAASRVV